MRSPGRANARVAADDGNPEINRRRRYDAIRHIRYLGPRYLSHGLDNGSSASGFCQDMLGIGQELRTAATCGLRQVGAYPVRST